MRRLTQSERTLVERARNPGASEMAVRLEDGDCGFLIATIAKDLAIPDVLSIDLDSVPEYFTVPPISPAHGIELPVEESLALLFDHARDSDTYFACLASLHKARLKHEQILRRQPFPTFDQIGPRGLLQFGTLSPAGLMSLLCWRKWLYDLDNRSAQDTGYLFEPILAHAIGGTPASARRSPVRRRSDGTKGRQVDCLRGKRAYEFKLRITIAASGQGRWSEELDFPADCEASGFTPVLLVLDPTPNPKLDELVRTFDAHGGEIFVGDSVWEHLEQEAGETMSVFLEKYVRRPLDSLLADADTDLADLSVSVRGEQVAITVGHDELLIPRADLVAPDGDAEFPDDIDSELPGV